MTAPIGADPVFTADEVAQLAADNVAGVDGVAVAKPDRGVAVLACRCGRMLGDADMRWAPPPPDDVLRPIKSIVCGVCRNQALTQGETA